MKTMSVYYCFGVDGRSENVSESMQKRNNVEEALILTPVQHHIWILFVQCSFAEMETITVKNVCVIQNAFYPGN